MKLLPFSALREVLEIDYDNLKNNDWDNYVIICGYEGRGKSSLTLHAIEEWIRISENREPVEEDINKYMGVKGSHWARIRRDFAKAQKHQIMNIFDEAGDVLDSKSAITKIVRITENDAKVTRGMNWWTGMNVPSFFAGGLTPYFRMHRVRCVWYIPFRGVCCVYYGETKNKLVAINENSSYKSMDTVRPDFMFEFPDYEGVFKKRYKELKQNKMYDVSEKTYEVYVEHDKELMGKNDKRKKSAKKG